MNSNSLPPPQFPQMTDDGVINHDELDSQGGVRFKILEYIDPAVGDYITFYFDATQYFYLYLAEEPVSQYFPWSDVIPSNKVPDGQYEAKYQILDNARNLSTSQVATVFVDRDQQGTLTPPIFPEALDDNTIDDAEAFSDGGTAVYVPVYSDMAVDDSVIVYWTGFNEQGAQIPRSATTVSYVVVERDLTYGLYVTIPTPYITAIGTGTAKAWYTVHSATRFPERSMDSEPVNINSTGWVFAPPIFKEGSDGLIDAQEAADGTPLLIPSYRNINVGDVVTTYWQGYTQEGIVVPTAYDRQIHTIAVADLNQGFEVIIPNAALRDIRIGSGESYYTVVFATSGGGTSLKSQVDVDTLHTILLNAPTFPEATNGYIDAADARSGNGTPMQIIYSPMKVGDQVTLQWTGYHYGDTNPVSGSVYTWTVNVSSTDVAAQSITSIIPTENILVIGTGYAIGNYQVSFIDGGIGNSNTQKLNINSEVLSSLTSSKSTINADGSDKASLSATVTDSVTGTGIPDVVVYWRTSLGTLSVPSSRTNQYGVAVNEISSGQPGNITVVASLDNGSSRSISITAGQVQKTLLVMGARSTSNPSAESQRCTLSVFDAATRNPITASWYYEGQTAIITAHTFLDTSPQLPLIVQNPSSSSDFVTVNPANILGNGGWTDTETSSGSFVALLNDRSIIGWGNAAFGGSTPPYPYNQSVSTLAATFEAFGCIQNSGAVFTWGNSLEGGYTPDDILARTDIIEIKGARGTFALRGRVYPYVESWGWGTTGGEAFSFIVPANIASMSDLTMLRGGDNAFAVVNTQGKVFAWGKESCGGTVPANISSLSGISDCCASRKAFAIIYGGGRLIAWGDSDYGSDASSVSYITNAHRLVGTESAFTALLNNGGMVCWGYAQFGGNMPSAYASRTDIVDVKASYGAFAALCTNGTVLTWGSADHGGNCSSVASLLNNVISITANAASFAALKKDGTVVTWGNASYGGTTSGATGQLSNVLAIYANTHAYIALKADSTVVAWGEQSSGVYNFPSSLLNGNISYLKK